MIFVGLENAEMMLREAQRLAIFKEKKAKDPKRQEENNKKRKDQEGYLHKRIIDAEKKRPYNV